MNIKKERREWVERSGDGFKGAVVATLGLLLLACGGDGGHHDGGKQSQGLTLSVQSSDATRVTGGDMRVRLHADEALKPAVRVRVDGAELPDSPDMEVRDGDLSGVISGLPLGPSRVEVEATTMKGDTLSASLQVVNHPAAGPVFSGPHLTPFECRTVDSDLGAPLDADCSVERRLDYFYFNQAGERQVLADPYGPRPSDLATTTTLSGDIVPYIVRVESGTVNRSIYRIAVLEDPQSEGTWNDGGWNGRLVFRLGESTGAQYNQGDSDFGDVFKDNAANNAIARGYGYIISTLNVNKVNVNDVVAAETMMMVKERFIEGYGVPMWMVGMGASGGAIQQMLIAQNYPGLLDGVMPDAAFPDVFGTAQAVSDCRLLNRYFTANPADDATRQAFEGHLTGICRNWDFGNGDAIVVDSGSVSPACGLRDASLVYDPVTNPDGVRCSLYDININTLGTDPDTGIVRRPLDNVGVQYGLQALRAGDISVNEFLDVNANVGGFDADGKLAAERTVADPQALALAYGRGRVGTGGGGLATVPIFHLRVYAEPGGDIHTIYNDIQIREKLIRENGNADNQVIWLFPRPELAMLLNLGEDQQDALAELGEQVSLQQFALMSQWLDDLVADPAPLSAAKVVAHKPTTATDACWRVDNGERVNEVATFDDAGVCNSLYPKTPTPRIAAGGPVADDILKCELRPTDDFDYGNVFFDGDQWDRLNAIFPNGVCDYSRKGVGQRSLEGTWLDYSAQD